jgi:hypothetical protein
MTVLVTYLGDPTSPVPANITACGVSFKMNVPTPVDNPLALAKLKHNRFFKVEDKPEEPVKAATPVKAKAAA